MTKYMVGTIQTTDDEKDHPRKHHHLNFVAELTPDEHEGLLDALKTVNKFLQDSQLFTMATWNFHEFMELLKTYLQAYTEKDIDVFVQKPININLNRAFLNLLSSTRSYLDFMERLLKNRYGEESALFNNFKKNCSAEYDGNFSYRFLYNLRHYAQHKGFPIGSISLGQRPSSDVPIKAIHFLEVYILRDEILSNFEWRKLENDIRNLPEEIDVVPQILAFMESLRRNHVKVIHDLFSTLNDSAQQILLYGEKLAGAEGEPVVFDYDGDIRNIQNLGHKSLPIKLAKQIASGQITDFFQHI